MNCGLNNNGGIQFADQKNNNRLKYPLSVTTRAKITLLPVFGRHLEFRGKESPDKVSIETVEKFTPQNMGIAFGILALGGTKPEIHLGGYIPPPIATYVLKNTIATLGLKLINVYLRMEICATPDTVLGSHR